jgi:hypothetical protein
MLYTQKLLAELERKRDQLAGYQDRYGEQLLAYREALCSLGGRFACAGEIARAQDARTSPGDEPPSLGARPTAEYDAWLRAAESSSGTAPRFPFGQTFANHQEARAWAECLRGTVTFAVDGSQILPWRDASVPLALVQVGLFENPHQPPAPYVKDVETEILTPQDVLEAEPDTADARTGELLGYSSQIVHLRRFELEVRTLVARMEHHARQRKATGREAPVVAFCDGSLIVSFALKMPPQYRRRYVDASRLLLQASEATRIPLVGYIDTSYARDIVTMLGVLHTGEPLPSTQGIHDALLWNRELSWGDRTPAFISARDDLGRMGYDDQRENVAFVYFQAAQDRPPARLEFPRWVLDAGLLDEVLRVVRAEAIAGNGYPYPIEAADAVAVISTTDRNQFYAVFQEFATRHHLDFSFSKKALSKSRRRV